MLPLREGKGPHSAWGGAPSHPHPRCFDGPEGTGDLGVPQSAQVSEIQTAPVCLPGKPPLSPHASLLWARKELEGQTPLYSRAQGGIQGCAVAGDAFNQQTPRKHPLRAHALLSWNSWALSPECHPLLLQLPWIETETKGSF